MAFSNTSKTKLRGRISQGMANSIKCVNEESEGHSGHRQNIWHSVDSLISVHIYQVNYSTPRQFIGKVVFTTIDCIA